VYVGVHFPIDVMGGAIFGSLIGFIFARLFKKFQPQF
jgi:membrane-associated phospholipid phosphatase